MGLFGKSKKSFEYTGIIDIHSHIIPCVDDGAKSLKQSHNMIDIAVENGISTIIVTPHRMPEGKNAPPDLIKARVELLKDYISKKNYDLEILPGNEIYYHAESAEQLEEGRALTLAGTDCVLVEFSPMDDARYIRNSVSELQNMGYRPIIAHVERYASLCKAPFEMIEELREMGIMIQVNAMSVTGGFGKTSKDIAKKLLKRGLVDFIASDAHSDGGRAPKFAECIECLEKICDSDYIEDLLYANAQRYIFDEI